MNKLKQIWSNLRSSFWFIPSLIVAVSIALAVVLVEAGSTGSYSDRWLASWPRLFGAGAAGARGMLSTIAGSMITVVGVTFSMTLVTLALASSQYTSRILRNFMRDRVTQVVLGIFTGIFTYCLVVLRTIRGGEGSGFIPNLAVAFGVVLAIGGISVLIFFIHHIALRSRPRTLLPRLPTKPWRPLIGFSRRSLETDRLTAMRISRRSPCRRRAGRRSRPGGMVISKTWITQRSCVWRGSTRPSCGWNEASASLWSMTPRWPRSLWRIPPEKEIIADLQEAYSINRYRTVEHDCAFGIRQIVDMALRALSPGINDTTTAVMCVDYLTAILARLASGQSLLAPL